MDLHAACRPHDQHADDLRLLRGLLAQRLYLDENDRRLLRALLSQPAYAPRADPRARRVRRARLPVRAGSAALLGGALALSAAGNIALAYAFPLSVNLQSEADARAIQEPLRLVTLSRKIFDLSKA